jgi:hypothetical protein
MFALTIVCPWMGDRDEPKGWEQIVRGALPREWRGPCNTKMKIRNRIWAAGLSNNLKFPFALAEEWAK